MKSGSKTKQNPSMDATENNLLTDPRFSHLVSDPRFKNIHKSTEKVKIDKRFKSMFHDDKFKVTYTLDKYGRKVNKSNSEDLRKYYDLSSEDEEEEKRKEEVQINKEDSVDNDALVVDELISVDVKEKLNDLSIDYARGKGVLLSDSSSDEETSDDEDELFIEHVWGELDAEAPHTEASTRRLAACNMDWDRIRSSDIMVLCHSFLPLGGIILSVTIYPSEFGMERMAEEEIKGPQELTDKKLHSDNEDDVDEIQGDNEEGSDYHMEKLRKYQLNRLKYYYAVIECNSVSTADKLYKECDGLEYESTATKLDLRFIPDDMKFDYEPKDVCSELPDLSTYMPRLFTTTALQQAKVELTWDENDVERKELNDKLMSGKLNEVADQDLRKYVAYSSEEDEESGNDENNQKDLISNKKKKEVSINSEKSDEDEESGNNKKDSLSKYKALLKDINKKEEEKKNNRIEMEFSWGIGLKDKPAQLKDNNKKEPELTHFEKILEKKKEKKKERKIEKKKLRRKYKGEGTCDDDSSADDLPDGIDMDDPYFAEEFANGEFEEEPKKLSNKMKRNKKRNDNKDSDEEQKKAELDLLLADDDDDKFKTHFSLKKIQDTENESKTKKRKKQLKRSKKQIDAEKALFEDDFKIDIKDDRFAAVYSSHLYSIDPTNSNFKKTKGMELLLQEKLKRRPVDAGGNEPIVKKQKKDVAVTMLVKSIKRKVANL